MLARLVCLVSFWFVWIALNWLFYLFLFIKLKFLPIIFYKVRWALFSDSSINDFLSLNSDYTVTLWVSTGLSTEFPRDLVMNTAPPF